MHYVDKGDSPKGGQYLRCDNGYRGNGCARHTIRYAECEAVILENCPNLRPEQVLPDPDKAASLCLVLSQRIQGKKAELGDIERQAENLVDMIASTSEKPIRKRYQDRISKLDARKIALAGELQNDERKLATAERGQKSFSKWTADLKTLQKALAAGDVDVRRKLQSHLREFIDRIEVFANGHRTDYDSGTRDGEDLALTIEAGISTVAPEFAASREFYEFSNYITKRRMSKEGRFLRIHFKSGAQVTLVPEGSLASGFELKRCANPKREPDWHWKSPDVDRLWGEFMGEPKKRGRRAKLVTTC
jgi:hypothetical protein